MDAKLSRIFTFEDHSNTAVSDGHVKLTSFRTRQKVKKRKLSARRKSRPCVEVRPRSQNNGGEDGLESRVTDHGDVIQEDKTIQSKATKTCVQDSDSCSSSAYDTDLEEDDASIASEREEHAKSERDNAGIGHVTYMEVCRSLGTVPLKKVVEQFKNHEMRLQHVGMNSSDCKALACALWHNTCLEALDLEDNGLDGEALVPVINAFKSNIYISSLSLSENEMGILGAMAMDDVLRESTWLTHLNLSGTRLGDKEIEYIAAGIQHNDSLRWLNLSHNEISINSAKKLGTALGHTSTLQVLDLSWNHIRMSGAVALSKGVKLNNSIINLNLSWNGFGYEGSLALEDTLRGNECLKFLDISNNRINWEGVSYVAKGLRTNSVLQMLKIGNNPINMEGCYELMKAAAYPRCKVLHIGLDNIPINGAVLTVVDDILRVRPFSFSHGGILDTRDIVGIRKEKREDPVTLLVRYLATIGIRVIDLFRMFDSDNHGMVSKEHFIRGLQKVGTPLGHADLQSVANRLDKQKKGFISYSILANGVRNHIREERLEVKRQEVKERNKVEERRRILQTELPPIFKRSYEDDLYAFYTSSSGFGKSNSPMNSSTNSMHSVIGGQSVLLPPLRDTSKSSTSESIISNNPLSTPLPVIPSASRPQTKSAPRSSASQKPRRLLSYINAYLERRRTQAQFDTNSLLAASHEKEEPPQIITER